MTHQYTKLPVTMKMWMQFNVMPIGFMCHVYRFGGVCYEMIARDGWLHVIIKATPSFALNIVTLQTKTRCKFGALVNN